MFRRALLAAAALVVFVAAPVTAHTELQSSDPANGATLQTVPETVTLTFGEDLLAGGDRIVAKDDTGVQVNLGPSQVKGANLSANWPATADGGTYTVSYRAVAADGHPLEGRIRFTIVTESAAPVASPTPASAQAEQTSTNPWIIAAPVLLIAALAAGGLFVWRSRE